MSAEQATTLKKQLRFGMKGMTKSIMSVPYADNEKESNYEKYGNN